MNIFSKFFQQKQKYIVYAPPYDDIIGGSIVLHKLCDLLNKCGQDAYIWQYNKELIQKNTLKYFKLIIKERIGYYKPEFSINKSFNTPFAKQSYLSNSIVIYPEIVDGNPLKAPKVIRWFLHKPGFHTSNIDYGDNELYFYFQKKFNDEKINKKSDNQLMIIDFKCNVYRKTNFNERKGRCFILRKGKDRKIIHDIKKHEVIDDLSHEKISEIFNKVEYCYSYDMSTMYSFYASLCGCKSIVVPDENITIEEWQPVKILRGGVAYGEQDLDRALSTRTQRIEYMKKIEQENINSVNTFINKSIYFFNTHHKVIVKIIGSY